ncbi:carbohydrate ABC transporter permease [Nakamurella endophytica]|uniref:Transporter integral membrane protein n=1 Tax=Nakamurella endophytica TaxID=1748367 RepID=A0A917T7S3_9ACTN|nr:sugar ABC transporter permease [Nakamurella endophytica]GGM13828.1 transporter integral membrane protein [Nakamurella endophytica]
MTSAMTLSAPPTPPPRGAGRFQRWLYRSGSGLFLLLPAAVPILLLSVFPLVRGIYLGFTDARAGYRVTTNFVGFDQFAKLAHNALFWQSFRIGLVWAVSVTVLQFLAALGLALLLNADLRLRWLARTLALVPWAMPPVIVAIMWRLLLDPTVGSLNESIRLLHLGEGTLNLLGQANSALPTVIVIGVWVGMPQTTVTLLAGLQSISPTLHEAAAVDGAGTWRRFVSVTLPQLYPIIAAITSLDFIWNFNSFGLVYVLTAGGPGGNTMLPMLFAYHEAFGYGNFGYASAMADVMVVLILLIMLAYLPSRLRRSR